MIRNYLRTTLRGLVNDKAYTFINIMGLTIGLCACMLVFTVVIDEQSYDKFWSRSEDLYKVVMINEKADGSQQKLTASPIGLGHALKEQFPEMEQYSSMTGSNIRLRIGQDNPDGVPLAILRADTNALGMLDFKMLDGNLPAFVAGHQNLLITERFRQIHFPHENPVGKIIEDVPSWSSTPESYVITGVIKDIPPNTHLRAEAVLLGELGYHGDLTKQGIRGMGPVFYLLKPGTDVQAFTNKMNDWYQGYMENDFDRSYRFELQSIRDIYLNSELNGRLKVKGNQRTLQILTGVGLLLLLIACVNFVNLSLAKAIKKIKDLGIRKILGAGRQQLIIQSLLESLLFFGIAACLAAILYILAIPVTEQFIGHELAHTLLSNKSWTVYTLLSVLLVCLITGIYPAWLFSGYKAANTLRGKLGSLPVLSTENLRKSLVVIQFSISIIVVIALLVVQQQLQYLNDKNIGYEKENLLHISSIRSWEGKGQAFKNELIKQPGIESASIAGWSIEDGTTSSYNNQLDHPVRDGEKFTAHFIEADFDFPKTMGLQLQSGRHLSGDFGADRTAEKEGRPILVTSSTAVTLGIEKTGEMIPKLRYAAVGILQDFHRQSLHHDLEPLFITSNENPDYAYLFVRTKPGMGQQAQESLLNTWKTFYPNRLLDAQWATDILEKQYEAERKQQTLFSIFSSLMLFLSALGILGLIIQATQQRVKEIGIRKVLGASVTGIVTLLSKDFVKLVFLAIVIASPVAWWAMNQWLQDFAYRIEMQWWMFGLSGLAALLIALLTVSVQAIRAAMANPVDSLRDE